MQLSDAPPRLPVEMTSPEAKPSCLDFDTVFERHYLDVARWVRALGANSADVADLTQEIFMIVHRKLPGFDGRHLKGFLYQITQRRVRDHRRSAWFRNLFRRSEPVDEVVLPSQAPNALRDLEQRERLAELEGMLAKMTEKRRAVFVLFEIEGYSGEEIAELQGVPINTVWTRLHHARKDLAKMVAEKGAAGA